MEIVARLRRHPGQGVPGAGPTRELRRALAGPELLLDMHRRLGLPHRRRATATRARRRRGGRALLRLVPRGPAERAARADLHLGGHARRGQPRHRDVRGPGRRSDPGQMLSVVDTMEARDAMMASGMEVGINDGFDKLDAILAEACEPLDEHGASPAHSPTASGRAGGRVGQPVAGAGVEGERRRTSSGRVVPALPRESARASCSRRSRRSTTTRSGVGAARRAVQRSSTTRATAGARSVTGTFPRCRSGRRSRVLHGRRLHAHVGPRPGDRAGRTARPGALPAAVRGHAAPRRS